MDYTQSVSEWVSSSWFRGKIGREGRRGEKKEGGLKGAESERERKKDFGERGS